MKLTKTKHKGRILKASILWPSAFFMVQLSHDSYMTIGKTRALTILSLCLLFVCLISMCLGGFLLGFILYGTLCASWTWLTISFSMVEKFSTIISSKVFSYPFFFSSSSGTPIIWMLVHLILSQKSLRLSSVLFILFTLFCSSGLFPLF